MKETFRFLINKHLTAHPHYDLFLEVGNELKSWIIPSGIPAKISEQKLAIEVEAPKQSLEETESREIIEDAYGTGKSKLWDKGAFTLDICMETKLIINCKGSKLKESFLLHVPNWGRTTKKRLWAIEKIS